MSIRRLNRLLYAFKKGGDQAVIHGLRGKPSNQRIEEPVDKEAVKFPSADVSKGLAERCLPVGLSMGPQPA